MSANINKNGQHAVCDKRGHLWWRGASYHLGWEEARLLKMFFRNRTTPSSPDAIRAALDNYAIATSGVIRKVRRLRARLESLGISELARAIRPAGRLLEPGSFVLSETGGE